MFSHRFAKLTAIAITGFLLSVLGSASPQAQGVLEDCASDITTYCAEVEPGHGRVLSCLYAYEDKISEACYAATIDFHDVMDFMFASVRDALASCAGGHRQALLRNRIRARPHTDMPFGNQGRNSTRMQAGRQRI
ncbi:cysteine rich repeat-containing protein [Roseibium salinum]|nr:cysteine rich repeat-containing protein [Roseibium salinum]